MKTPYLIAEIPSGPDGHIAVTEPGIPLGDGAVVAIVQRCRDQTTVIRSDLLAVARDSLQSSGRVGRAVLALCNVNTDLLTHEQRDNALARLNLRLDSVGQLAQHESLRDARGAVASCPLLSVWADLDGLHKLPVPNPEPLFQPGPNSPSGKTERPGTPWPRGLVGGAAALAGLAMVAAALTLWPKSPDTTDKGTADLGSRGGPVPAPQPKSQAGPAPAPAAETSDSRALASALDQAAGRTLNLGGDPLGADLLDLLSTWPKRLVQLDNTKDRDLFTRYRDLLANQFDASARAAGRAASRSVAEAVRQPVPGKVGPQQAIEGLARSVKNHDAAIESLTINNAFSYFGDDVRRFRAARLALLRTETLTALHEAAFELIGKPGEARNRQWADLKALAETVKTGLPPFVTAPDAQGQPYPVVQHLNAFADLVGALETREAFATIALRFQNADRDTPPEIHVRWPENVVVTYPTAEYPARSDRKNGERAEWKVREVTTRAEGPWKSVVLEFEPIGDTSTFPQIECKAKVPAFFNATLDLIQENPPEEGKKTQFQLSGARILWLVQELPHSRGSLIWSTSGTFQRLDGGSDPRLNPRESPLAQLRRALGDRPEPSPPSGNATDSAESSDTEPR